MPRDEQRDVDRPDVDRREGERERDRREARRYLGARQPRLDVPRETRHSVPRPHYDPETFGRFAEAFARFMGTGKFLIYMSVFIVCWITLNVVLVKAMRWDAYPFILLNLIFSTQASYAAPLILLAQNRQEARDRVVTEQDRDANARAHADMEYLAREVAALRMAVGEVATRDFLRSELRSLMADLEERSPAPEGTASSPYGDEEATEPTTQVAQPHPGSAGDDAESTADAPVTDGSARRDSGTSRTVARTRSGTANR